MVVNKKVTGKAMSMPAGLALGTGIGLIVTLVMAALGAYLVLGGKLPEKSIGYISMAALLASSALGAIIAATRIKRRWMIVCLSVGTIYYFVLLGWTALFFGGQYQGLGITALLVLIGCGAVGLIGLRKEKGSAKRHRKYRSR